MTNETHGMANAYSRGAGRRALQRKRVLCFALTGIVAALAAAPAAPAHHGRITAPDYPTIQKCSTQQRQYLRDAWWEAYRYAVRADNLVAYIDSRPSEDDRRRLWSQDFAGYGNASGWRITPSPQRFFGAYDATRLGRIRGAIREARRRLSGEAQGLNNIRKLICRKSCPKASAYHAVRGKVNTCPRFWSRALGKPNPFDTDPPTDAERLAESAHTLAHEVFHHIRTHGALYVQDYHADGAGGHPDQKYYDIGNVTYLARNKPDWAMRNNDTYAYFVQAVKHTREPLFSAVYAAKESSGTGGMFGDMTWAQLMTRKGKQAARGQYLADVETYVRHGQRLFAGLWRVGAGDGALLHVERAPFLSSYTAARTSQDLIDVEIYRENGKSMMVGLFRQREAGAGGVGGLLVDMSWKALVDNWRALAPNAYLADVETYIEGATRKYAGVWRVGQGTGDLVSTPDTAFFASKHAELRHSQQLIDLERFRDGDGRLWQLGVWRQGASGGQMYTDAWAPFVSRWLAAADSTLIDIEEESLVPMQA